MAKSECAYIVCTNPECKSRCSLVLTRRQRRKLLGGWVARHRQNKRLGELVDDLEARIGPVDPKMLEKIEREMWSDE